jgi:hypothetical protein
MNLFPKIYATTGNVGIRSMLAIPKVFVSYGSALKCLAVHVYSSMHIAAAMHKAISVFLSTLM